MAEEDAHYYATHCGIPYQRNDHWLGFFRRIAERIVQDMAPSRVLDAGCAMGFLVEALRDLGVDAYGVDVSDYALSQAREDIRPYLRKGSLTEPLQERYDLIVCIEVLEHLAAADAEAAVANLCAHADDVLFSSTPSDYAEASHVNVQPGERWAELFALHGMFRDVDYDATFLTGWSVRFRRSTQPVHLLVKGYERAHLRLQEEAAGRRAALEQSDRSVASLSLQHAALEEEHARLSQANETLRTDIERLTADLSLVQSLLVEAERRIAQMTVDNESMRAALDSVTWKLGTRVQKAAERMAPPASRRGRSVRRAAKAALVLAEGGPGELARRLRRHRNGAHPAPLERDGAPPIDEGTREYLDWLAHSTPTPTDLRRMKEDSDGWARRPLVSVVMPTYNSVPAILREAVDSVRAQCYGNWELCIADDASSRPEVRAVLDEYAEADPRIKVTYRDGNGGIAAASNSALELATGEYVALLDHDDVLVPHALYRMVQHVLDNPDDGLVYSDEDKLRADGSRGEPFFKPDWSPDLLYSVNYVCHLTMMRRDLVSQVGGFHQGFDGSQDYDLFLRIVDTGTGVGHVPDVLYSWRQMQGSTALTGDAKPAAYDAGRRAIEASLQRRGDTARVDAGRIPTRYEVRRRIAGGQTVAVVIPTRDRVELLRAAIESVERNTRYSDYRIVIVDNDSRDPATLDYLRGCGHQVVPHPGPFNYSKIVNAGVAATRSEHVLLLNNDVEVITPEWMEAMVEHSQRREVGAVGGRLLFPDGRPQHEGIGVGMGWLAGNLDHEGYMALGLTTRNCSGVTGACAMVRREVWEELGGLDERIHVAFNDVDLCLRIRERGYWIVYTPLAELYHNESSSRGRLHPMADEALLIERWGTFEDIYDPFINANVLHFHPLKLREQPKLRKARAAAVDPVR